MLKPKARKMLRSTLVQIDRSALTHNLALLKKWNGPGSFFCPMVKANAYGHDEVLVARILEDFDVDAIGVALYEEGLALREAGIRAPILVFAPMGRVAASAAITHQLTPVLGRGEDLETLIQISGRSSVDVHLKFNTGMNRLGFDENELDRLKTKLKDNPTVAVKGVCTHLAQGEEAHQPESFTQKQLAQFERMAAGFPGVRHAHKSLSLISLAQNHIAKDPQIGARPGIALYGLGIAQPEKMDLRPALRWSTRLIRVHNLEKGENAGYSARWKAPRKSVIGVVPVGYGDGYFRSLSGRGEMLFRETRVPVVGNVCMDYILLDLTDACRGENPRPDEVIIILGSQGRERITAAWLAERAGTIDYEIVTAISRRVPREVL